MAAPRPIRRKRIQQQQQQQNDKLIAKWCFALVCLWPLVVLLRWGGKSTPTNNNNLDGAQQNNHHHSVGGVHHNNIFQIRKYLDRVDVMGYGPTHPRVAVVIVGTNRDEVLASVESVFRNTAMERIFLICAVMDGVASDAKLVKKLNQMDEGAVPHWHGLKKLMSQKLDDDDDEEEEPHGKKTYVLFNGDGETGTAASRNDAVAFITLLEEKHEQAGLKSPEEDLLLVFLKSGAELNDKQWLKPVTSALVVPAPFTRSSLLLKNYFNEKTTTKKNNAAVSFGVESDDGTFTQTKAVGFSAALTPQWMDSKASDLAASNGNSFPSPALAGVATAMRLATYRNLPVFNRTDRHDIVTTTGDSDSVVVVGDYEADLDLALNLWLCADGIDILNGIGATAKNAHVFTKDNTRVEPSVAAQLAATWMDAARAEQVFAKVTGVTRLEWDTLISKAKKKNNNSPNNEKCRSFQWYVENVNTVFTEEEEEGNNDDASNNSSKTAAKVSDTTTTEKEVVVPDKQPLEIPKVMEEEVFLIPERKEDDEQQAAEKEKKLDPPLDPERLALLQKSKPVDIAYVNITDRSDHPHKGAKDADGNWGYVHDPTALRKNPPPFTFPDLESACALRDNDYKMMTEQVSVVDVKAHDAVRRRRDKIFCLVYTIAESHDRIPYIRETWGPKCDGFMVGSTKTDASIGAVEILHEGPQEYNNIWQKVRSMWSFIYDNYYEDYDWFHIGGDDLVLIVENLRLYLESDEIRAAQNDGGFHVPPSLESMTHQVPLFLGGRFAYQGDVNNVFLSGGSGYTLNKAALKTLVVEGLPKDFQHQKTFLEDTRMAEIFKKFSIFPYDTQDSNGSERYNPFMPGHHWGYRPLPDMSKDWYAKYTIPLDNAHWDKGALFQTHCRLSLCQEGRAKETVRTGVWKMY